MTNEYINYHSNNKRIYLIIILMTNEYLKRGGWCSKTCIILIFLNFLGQQMCTLPINNPVSVTRFTSNRGLILNTIDQSLQY